jgi:hypothetical protein
MNGMKPESDKKNIFNVHNTAYVRKITPIDLCGKTIMWQLSLDGVFTVPFEIEPTKGKHDYNQCATCKKNIARLTKELTERLEGTTNKKGFPFCCPGHSNLPKVKEFKIGDFVDVPNLVARKVIYTIQHFINVADTPDWYKRISDYLEWVLLSFGQMPKDCGEPLFLTTYFVHVEDLSKRNEHIPAEKKDKIFKMIKALRVNKSSPTTDLNILAKTYERWINTFPFGLNSYFGSMREDFTKRLLLSDGEPQMNIYSGLSRIKMHTKESLIEALVKLTDKLLTEINGVTLYEKGLITDANKIRVELIINERKAKLKQGYNNASANEDNRYRKIIKEWFRDEKRFFDELSPLLIANTVIVKKGKGGDLKAPIIALFCFLVNESLALERKPGESVFTYCKRVCSHYKLKFSDRVRQGYSSSRNNTNIEKVKRLIFPHIDQRTKDVITKYLDSKQPPKESMYA